MFIVQAKPREAEGIVKVVKDTRNDALLAAKDFLDQGFLSSVTATSTRSRSLH